MEKIEVRNVTREELGEVVRVESEAWPEEIRAPKEKFEKRIEVFQPGFFAVYVDGVMAGVSTSEIIRYPNINLTSWERITDNGFIQRSHDPNGNALYVVSVGVSRNYQRRGLGSKLVEAQKELTRKLGLDLLILGTRLPQYYKHKALPVERYVQLRNDMGEPLDPELRFYGRADLSVERIVPNYMEDDPESLNYGVVMVWKNKR